MYNVSRQEHETYGKVILLSIEEIGTYENPFRAIEQIKLLRRLWLEEGATKVKILFNDQIFTVKEIDSWSIKEYKLLPKCHNCARILKTNVFVHRLSEGNLFCTQKCADVNYTFEVDKLNDEEEIEYL